MVYQPPRRIALAEIPAFDQAFYIEDLEAADKQLDLRTWEFVYRLRPRSVKVESIPSIPLAFYDPDIPFPDSRFQIDYSDPIPLKVLASRIFERNRPPLPKSVYSIVEGPALLERREPSDRWPPAWLIVAALAVPPLVCYGWYEFWRRRVAGPTRADAPSAEPGGQGGVAPIVPSGAVVARRRCATHGVDVDKVSCSTPGSSTRGADASGGATPT